MNITLSPHYGHGSDPIAELYADTLLINLSIIYEEGTDFTVENDFRRFGIIRGVEQYDSSGLANPATSNTLSAKEVITLAGSFSVAGDGLVFGEISGAIGLVIDQLDDDIRIIRSQKHTNKIPFLVGENLIAATGGSTSEIVSINRPEYVPFSGRIVYINNIEPIQRSDDQLETINFQLQF